MTDRSWMLNPTAISAARTCIQIVQQELDIKLKLSHPQFLELLQEYAELTDSPELDDALKSLLVLADKEVPTLKHEALAKRAARPAASADREMQHRTQPNDSSSEEFVEYRGKHYPKYNEQGLTFQGLYRGQARYS